MRHDMRPYWVKKAYLNFRRWYTEYFLRPECEYLGPYYTIMKPWYVHISGNNVRIGHSFTAIGEPGNRVEIGVWGRSEGEGRVTIGDACLMSLHHHFSSRSRRLYEHHLRIRRQPTNCQIVS